MLKKGNRLDRSSIGKVFKEGCFISGKSLNFKFIISEDRFTRAVSFIVPKSISKRSRDRNLLRRRGYAILKESLADLPKGIKGAFIFGPASLKLYGGYKSKTKSPIDNLRHAIKEIIYKIH